MSPLRAADLSPAMAKRLGITGATRQKFNAKKQTVDGHVFDSRREAARHGELVYRLKAGEIENLQLQPQYLMTRDGVVLATYTADFRFYDKRLRAWVVEDCKGGEATKTEAYMLRKVFVEAQYGIRIQEI